MLKILASLTHLIGRVACFFSTPQAEPCATEEEWLSCSDPFAMLAYLKGKASERKLRLFKCACCRFVWPLLKDQRWHRVVELAESYADGQATAAELRVATREAEAEIWPFLPDREVLVACMGVTVGAASLWDTPLFDANHVAHFTAELYRADPAARQRAWEAQCEMLRDLFGNPFRPENIDPSWLTANGGTVQKLTQVLYAEQGHADLPILADALEEAGCDNSLLLAHCREHREHWRGCWVLDLILNKK